MRLLVAMLAGPSLGECALVFRLSRNLECLLQVRAVGALRVERVHASLLEAHADELGHECGLDAVLVGNAWRQNHLGGFGAPTPAIKAG